MFIHARGKVDSADAIPSAAELPVGVDGPDAEVPAEILRDAAHGERCPLAVERIFGRGRLAGIAIVDKERANVGIVDFPRHARAIGGVHDVARVDQVDGRGKIVCIFEEERAQFRKIDGVTLIHRELRLLRFHRTEVGIDGGVEHQALVENHLGFTARRAFEVSRTEVRIQRIEVDEGALVLRQHIGVQLQVVRTGHAGHAVQSPLLAEHPGGAGRDARPVVDFAVTWQVAREDDSPIGTERTITNALERDADQGHPAVRGDVRLGIPDLVIAVIGIGVLAPFGVGLDAGRIHFEENALAAVLKGVEEHRDIVVLQNVLPAREVAAYVGRPVIPTDENNVKRAARVAKPHLRVFGGRFAIARRVLDESADLDQLFTHAWSRVLRREVGKMQGFRQKWDSDIAGTLGPLRFGGNNRRVLVLCKCLGQDTTRNKST